MPTRCSRRFSSSISSSSSSRSSHPLFATSKYVLSFIFKYSYEFHGVYYDRCNILIFMSLVMTLFAMYFILAKERIALNLDILRNNVSDTSTIFSSGRIYNILIFWLLQILQPYPYIIGYGFYMYSATLGSNVFYTYNDALQLLSMIRIFYALIKLINMTMWRSTSSQRICKMYGCDNDILFGVKALTKENPIVLTVSMLIAGIMFFSVMIRYADAPANNVSYTPINDLYRFDNCLWLVIITMTTGKLCS